MRIINETKWETKPLRSVFVKCLAEIRRREGGRWELSGQTVKVVTYRSRWGVGGHAAYHSRHLTIKIPVDADSREHPLSAYDLADTYIHEVGHNLGVKHHYVGRKKETIEHLFQEWLHKEFDGKPCFVKSAAKPKPNPIELRYQRATKNLVIAKTRLRRATTIFRKWHRTLAYYEKSYSFAKKK